MTPASQKDQLRQTIKTKIAALSESEKQAASLELLLRLKPFIEEHAPNWRKNGVGLFQSLPDEINVSPLRDFFSGLRIPFQEAALCKKAVLFSNQEKPDFYNTSVFFIPGLAFDRKGQRLGRGKGAYDSFLHTLDKEHSPAITIGLGYNLQLIDEVPVEKHDKKVHYICTPSAFFKADL